MNIRDLWCPVAEVEEARKKITALTAENVWLRADAEECRQLRARIVELEADQTMGAVRLWEAMRVRQTIEGARSLALTQEAVRLRTQVVELTKERAQLRRRIAELEADESVVVARLWDAMRTRQAREMRRTPVAEVAQFDAIAGGRDG